MEELISCAAIHYNWDIDKLIHLPKNIDSWIVICWFRHSNCFEILWSIIKWKKINYNNLVQWFITNKNRFLNREEAFLLATKSNQIIKKNYSDIKKELFSEDIY